MGFECEHFVNTGSKLKKSFFSFFNIFLFSKRFLFLKIVGKVQSGKQINKKHFQNNSNEKDLRFFTVACRMT